VLDNLKTFEIESDEYQKYYHALLKLAIESHKLKLSERDTSQLLKELAFNEEQTKAINEYIKDQHDVIAINNLRFIDLEWRLEAKIASRSTHAICMLEPKILIKMNVDSENFSRYRSKIASRQQAAVVMTTSSTNLIHIIQKLEQALIESKTLTRK
jgi:hypothetical protein